MPLVRVGSRVLPCADGARLRDVLRDGGVPVYQDPTGLVRCHGLGTCGTCAFAVAAPDGTPLDPEAGPLSAPTAPERWRLGFPPHADGLAHGLRLTCQARVHGDVTVVRRGGFWGHLPAAPPPINVDLGEHADEPDALYALADAANIACGGHAGDAASMDHALARCAFHGTTAGAHPSFPDRAGFGRTALALPPDALEAALVAQLEALAEPAARRGVRLQHVKPHGALYHAADGDDALADALTAVSARVLGAVTLVGPAVGASETAGAIARAAARAGLPYAAEGFADRGVDARGALRPRGTPGALLTDPAQAAARARQLVGWCDTLCVHADTPGALEVLRAVRGELGGRGA